MLEQEFLRLADAESIPLVIGGFFWCMFGIFLRKLHNSSAKGKTLIQTFKDTSKKELLFKSMIVLAAMRFFRVIFDTDEIAFAGFVIGLSLDILPEIIFSIPKYFTSKFDPYVKKDNEEEILNKNDLNQDEQIIKDN
jgi:hypothetical protein